MRIFRVFSVVSFISFLIIPSLAQAAKSAVIENGKVVKFHYTLSVEGKELESSEGNEPLSYQQGQGTIIPGLEAGMLGLKVGDTKTITVSPEDGYGMPHAEAITEVPKSQLPQGEEIIVGTMLASQQGNGQIIQATVKEIKEETVILDFNHPLAGKSLTFEVEVVEVK